MSSITMRFLVIGLAVLLTLPFTLGCCTIAGGLLGGGTGAVVGGGAGLLCGKPSEGMAAGATAGAVVGGGAGLVCDTAICAPFAIVGKVLGCDKSHEALSSKDIEQLCKAGVDDQVIITQIEQVGMKEPLSVKEIVRLQQQGVSPAVIQMAQQHPQPVENPQIGPIEVEIDNSAQLATSQPDQSPGNTSVVSDAPLPPPSTPVPSTPAEIAPMFESVPTSRPYATNSNWHGTQTPHEETSNQR